MRYTQRSYTIKTIPLTLIFSSHFSAFIKVKIIIIIDCLFVNIKIGVAFRGVVSKLKMAAGMC